MKRESELARAAANLAVLHRKLNQESAVVLNGEAEGLSVRRSPLEEIRRHNRELKKVAGHLSGREYAKNEFEFLFLNSFEKMYAMAEAVEKQLEESGCMELYRQSVEKGRLTHGDYNYHNLLSLPGGTAVTGFEHMGINIQAHDLYYFIRKAMEKFRSKRKYGRIILEAYEKERELENAERKYIGLSLAYPEKFWKTASSYYHSNKAWLPEKSVEKLETVVQQWDEKISFSEKHICSETGLTEKEDRFRLIRARMCFLFFGKAILPEAAGKGPAAGVCCCRAPGLPAAVQNGGKAGKTRKNLDKEVRNRYNST